LAVAAEVLVDGQRVPLWLFLNSVCPLRRVRSANDVSLTTTLSLSTGPPARAWPS